MALDTLQKRMAAINVGCPWRGPLVDASETGTNTGNREAAVYLYSGIAASGTVLLPFVLDINTRLWVYLGSVYGFSSSPDLNSMIERYLRGLTGDYNNRWKQLIQDATTAMGG